MKLLMPDVFNQVSEDPETCLFHRRIHVALQFVNETFNILRPRSAYELQFNGPLVVPRRHSDLIAFLTGRGFFFGDQE